MAIRDGKSYSRLHRATEGAKISSWVPGCAGESHGEGHAAPPAPAVPGGSHDRGGSPVAGRNRSLQSRDGAVRLAGRRGSGTPHSPVAGADVGATDGSLAHARAPRGERP